MGSVTNDSKIKIFRHQFTPKILLVESLPSP